jgi:hypothetical protein
MSARVALSSRSLPSLLVAFVLDSLSFSAFTHLSDKSPFLSPYHAQHSHEPFLSHSHLLGGADPTVGWGVAPAPLRGGIVGIAEEEEDENDEERLYLPSTPLEAIAN